MKTRKKSLNKKNLPKQDEVHSKPNQDDSNNDKLLKTVKVILPTVDENTDTSTPKHGQTKINQKECFTERRQSRRLNNLPPLDIIMKTEYSENINLQYGSESHAVLNCIKKIKQRKSVKKQKFKVFDDINSKNQEDILQTSKLSDDKLLNKNENQNFSFDQSILFNKIIVEVEPIDNSSLLNGNSEENIKHLEAQESLNETVIPVNNKMYEHKNKDNTPLELNQNKSLIGKAHLNYTPAVEKSVSLKTNTQQNVNPINNVLLHENQCANRLANTNSIFHIIDSKNQEDIIQTSKLIGDKLLDKSENRYLFPDQCRPIDKIDNSSLLNEDHDESIKFLSSDESQIGAHFKITPEVEKSYSLNNNTHQYVKPINNDLLHKNQCANSSANTNCIFHDIKSKNQEDIVQTSKLIDNKLLAKSGTQNFSFDQSIFVDKVNENVESIDNSSLLNGDSGENIKHLEADESQNEKVIPVNNKIYDDKNKDNMPLELNQNKSLIGEAHLKYTPDVENNLLLHKNQDSYDVYDSQEKSLGKTSLKVDYINLTKDEVDKINQNKIIEKSISKLRCVSSELLYKSPTFAKLIQDKCTSITEIPETPSLFKTISNSEQTNSENVNTNDYTGLYNSYNNIIDDKSSNLTSSNLKIIESWSCTPSDCQVYSEETNKKNYTPEINSKITKKVETPSKDNFEAPKKLPQIKDIFNTQDVNLQDVSFDMAKINCKETHFNVTNIEATCPEKSHSTITEKKDETCFKTTNITSTPKLPKPFSEMTIFEKRLHREKLSFMSSLGLVPVGEIKNTTIEKETDPKCSIQKTGSFLSKSELHTTTERAYYRTSSEKLKRSYLLEYSDDIKKHKAVPVLVPEKTSGLSFHEGRNCKDKCSSCHGKFGLLDTPCHIAQIKNHDKQKACLENATHLIGPNSCLCNACFRSLEKPKCDSRIPKHGCIVMPCKRTANRVFSSPWLPQIKKLLPDRGMVLRSSFDTKENMLFCHIHYNKVENIIKCQLCGCRSTPKYLISCEEASSYQKVLHNDKVYFTIEADLFICKPCKIYFLWQTKEKKNHSKYSADFEKHRITVLQRACSRHKIALPSHLKIQKIRQQSHNNQHMSAVSLPLNQTQPNKQSNQLSETVVHRKKEISNFKETVFVPVLKPVDNLDFLSTFPHGLKQVHRPIQLQPSCQPHPKPTLMDKKKNQLQKNGLKITTHIERNPLKLFRKLQAPYPNPGDLVNHLLLLEKCRRLGIVKFENNTNENKNVDTTKLQSQVDSNPTNQTSTLKHNMQLISSNQVQENPRVENNCIVEARKNYNQQNTSQPFVPITKAFNYVRIPQTVHAENLVCNPTQNYDKTHGGFYNNKQVVMTKIPTTSNNGVKTSTMYNIKFTPPATNIGAFSKNNITSTNSSVSPLNSIVSLKTNCNVAPAVVTNHQKSIKNLPNKVIYLKKLDSNNETLVNINSVTKETEISKTQHLISK